MCVNTFIVFKIIKIILLMDKIKKTDHFYLIDGSGYIFRAYYALPPLTRKSDGLTCGCS